jgi:hypothetical protein
MKTIIIILLLILLPCQGIIYSMPVPSQSIEKKTDYEIQGGGTSFDDAPLALKVCGVLFFALPIAGSLMLSDGNDGTDNLGIGLLVVAPLALLTVFYISGWRPDEGKIRRPGKLP